MAPVAAEPTAASFELGRDGREALLGQLGVRVGPACSRRLLLVAVASAPLALCVGTTALILAAVRHDSAPATSGPPPAPSTQVPSGVNLGGWLCLEDWFYSGTGGRSVSTGAAQPQGQGACLPPLLPQLPEHWPSEGLLTKRLNDTHGPARAAEMLMAHRRSFVGSSDLEAMASLGIQQVRIPLTWAAFADALAPHNPAAYGSHNPENDAVVVPDPFYGGTSAFVTVPRAWLAGFVRKAAQHNLKVLLDIHAFPGGSSDGTYNGVWPQAPVFWKQNVTGKNGSVAMREIGLWVARALIKWVEGLDAAAQAAVGGLTLMNEPAHLSSGHKWASEGEVLHWLEQAAAAFRASSLPGRGVKLYVNVIETAFKDFSGTVGPWWAKTFSEAEQQQWAVMDRHWYTAWAGDSCSGRTVSGGAYTCDQPLDEIRSKLRECARGWAEDFAKQFKGLKAVTEFSAGTFDQALGACMDPSVLGAFLEEQVAAFTDSSVEPFFWSWRMPYGPVFEPGWSLKHLLGKEVAKAPAPCLPPLTETCSGAALRSTGQ